MPPLHNSENGSPLKRLFALWPVPGPAPRSRSDPEDFRNYPRAPNIACHVSDFSQHVSSACRNVSDAIAKNHDPRRNSASRSTEGAGPSASGGLISLVPDAGTSHHHHSAPDPAALSCLWIRSHRNRMKKRETVALAAATATGIGLRQGIWRKSKMIEKLAPSYR